MKSPLNRLVRLLAAGLRRLREQINHEAQVELNRQLSGWPGPRGPMRPAHIESPLRRAAGALGGEDPLEQLWRLPARRPRRAPA